MTRERHERARIDDYFAARGGPADERVMREHIGTCESCRAYFDRRVILQELDPAAPSREARLLHGLGIAPARSRWQAWTLLVPAAAVLVGLMLPLLRDPSAGFVARSGGTAEPPAFTIYRAADRQRSPGQVAVNDELAFSYRNPGGRARLMIFAVDEHRHVYWYHPAFIDPATNPVAVPIEKSLGERELPEAIAQQLDGAALTMYGLFTDRALSVREVETAIAHDGRPSIDGAQTIAQELRISR